MDKISEEFSNSAFSATSFADKAVQRFIEVYEKLPKSGKPTAEEFTVLAGILLFRRSTGYMEVVSIATGTKCIGGSKLLANGSVVHDSHAEILARRGLLIYLYETIKITLKGEITMFKLEDNKLELSSDYEFHFFSSQLPCGDACIMPKDEDFEFIGMPVLTENQTTVKNKRKAENDISNINSKEPRLAPDIQRTGAKCLPHCEQDTREPGTKYHLLGQVRTKPGRGERTLSVSCSDKISKWINLGIQGSLLGILLKKPIYLKSIIIGGRVPYNQESLERALLLRNPNFKIENVPIFEQSSVMFPYIKSNVRHRAGPTSIVWVNLKESFTEVGANGIRLGLSKKFLGDVKKSLQVSKYYMYNRFVQLLLLYKKETLKEMIGVESVQTIPYNEMKRKNKEYYDKWAVVKKVFFKTWTIKPDIWDFCASIQ